MTLGNKIIIVLIAAFFIAIAGGYAYINATSGLDSPLSVIMSSSMQHDNDESELGVIDTGDVMIIKSPTKLDSIQSYIEGIQTGYKTFGDYGNVIIYERGDDVNPCIHRAIVWINYNGDNTWSIPSLANYEGSWHTNNGSTNINALSGILTFEKITQSEKTVSINLDSIGKQSGYLTMGDNPQSNTYFDQSAGIINHPVGTDEIRAVAMYEIPWMGIIKVYMTEDKKSNLSHVPNSIYSLAMLFIVIFGLIYCCDIYHVRKETKKLQDMIIELDDI